MALHVPELIVKKELEPFVTPSDEVLFRTIVESKSFKHGNSLSEERDTTHRRIHEKSTLASRMQATFTINDAKRSTLGFEEDNFHAKSVLPGSELLQTGTIRRRTKESAAEFLAKKREIFLVQMNLDTKRSEICKLEERAQQRETALKRSEEMLEEDAMKFDAFLKENDNQVQQTLKRADIEAKRKQEKVSEIKQLNAELSATKSELNKFEEQLEDFLQYKRFLDSVTPPEWFIEQQSKQKTLEEEKLEKWKKQCDAIKKRKSDALIDKNTMEQEYSNARTQQEAEAAERRLKEAVENLKAAKLLKEPSKPTEDELGDKEAEEETYFKSPQQLLDHYSSLEEQNLFLIQNLQETEEGLDRNRTRLTELTTRMNSESEALQKQIKQLQQIRTYKKQRRKEGANVQALQFSPFSITNQASAVTLEDLEQKLKEVYSQSGFVVDRGVGMLAMLTNIEMKLEGHLKAIVALQKAFVEKSERAREKDRRQKYREEKQAQQKLEHEARVKRALQRAEAPAFKKTGKPDMFRSIIPTKKRLQAKDLTEDDSQELTDFLSKELL